MRVSSSSTIDCANPVNRTHPLTQGLVAWYLCVPGLMGGARLHDLMSLPGDLRSGKHGTLRGIAPDSTSGFNPTNRLGGFGEVRFDGVNDFVDCGTHPSLFNGTGDATISVWAMMTSTTTNQMLLMLGSESLKNSIYLHLDSANKLQFGSWAVGSSDVPTIPNSQFQDGRWHLLTGTKRGDVLTLYFDGVPQMQKTVVGINVTVGSALLGSAPSAGLRYLGQLDSAVIFNRALSSEQVANLYANSLLGCPGLLRRVVFLALAETVSAPEVPGAEYVWRGDRLHHAWKGSRLQHVWCGDRLHHHGGEEL